MGRSRGRLLFVVFSVSLSWPSLSSAQDQPAPQDNSARPLGAKELKKRNKRLLKELGSQGGDWLRDEVPEVITEAERLAFFRLSTNAEREQFIEIFWQKRNPEPDSPNNTAREEHYRRLAYTPTNTLPPA